MENKKILIVSASIGTGHMQAARAIQDYCQHNEPKLEVKHVDFLSQETLSLDNIIRETYIKLLDIFPMFYEMLYKVSQRKRQGDTVQTFVSWMLKNRMMKLIEKEKPDILVFTHPFPCGAACILKRQKLINIPIVGVITDFAVHQFWVYPQVDRYCVGSKGMVQSLTASGIAKEKIDVTGMPIHQDYYERPERNYMNEKNTRALIMGGGLGLGDIQSVLRELSHTEGIDSIDVVAGHNESLYDNLLLMQKSLTKPINIYGYTKEIPLLMRKASLLITKPGGLTCQEAVTMGLPMVFFSAIPGQEEENAIVFENLQCAKWIKDIDSLAVEVESLVNNPSELQRMSDATMQWQENGAYNIITVIRQLLKPKHILKNAWKPIPINE